MVIVSKISFTSTGDKNIETNTQPIGFGVGNIAVICITSHCSCSIKLLAMHHQKHQHHSLDELFWCACFYFSYFLSHCFPTGWWFFSNQDLLGHHPPLCGDTGWHPGSVAGSSQKWEVVWQWCCFCFAANSVLPEWLFLVFCTGIGVLPWQLWHQQPWLPHGASDCSCAMPVVHGISISLDPRIPYCW